MTAVKYKLGMFPPKNIDWGPLIPYIGPASAAIARYDGTLRAIPEADVLLSPLTTREAVLSSRIEGTQATMGEVLEFEADSSEKSISEERRGDIQEVLNYRRSMRVAERILDELPLSLRVVKEIHSILLDGVRGQGKAPGEFRKIPNWIGPPGCSIEEARFVPVDVNNLPNALSTWESYIHSDVADKLIQLAIIHAEFEALHPFLDGNGRLGRMLVPLFLWQKELVHRPMFYVSAYLEANRDEYYDRLLRVTMDDDWTGWCKFFLEAVRIQAEENQAKAMEILELYNTLKPQVVDLTHSQYSIHALDWMFSNPIFKTTTFVKDAQIPEPTARRIVRILKKNNIIKQIGKSGGSRAATMMFARLLNIAEGHDIF